METLQSPTSPVDCSNKEIDQKHDKVETIDPHNSTRVVEGPYRIEPTLCKVDGMRSPIVPSHKRRIKPLLCVDDVEGDDLYQAFVHRLRIRRKLQVFKEGREDYGLKDLNHAPQAAH